MVQDGLPGETTVPSPGQKIQHRGDSTFQIRRMDYQQKLLKPEFRDVRLLVGTESSRDFLEILFPTFFQRDSLKRAL